ncbi:MAG TPA: type II toxin-antitoxin system VapC family toxin [Pyrinomonadaceae bacterium]|jgi:predicted nucleic acid-binding protein
MSIIEVTFEYPLAFDTSVFTHLRKNQPYVLNKIFDYFSQTQRVPALPAMTIFEAKWGVEKEYSRNNITKDEYKIYIARIDELTSQHRILPFDQKAAGIASFIYARLGKSDQNKHWEDLFVISTAIAHNHGLITQNVKDSKFLANYLPEGVSLRLAVWKP